MGVRAINKQLSPPPPAGRPILAQACRVVTVTPLVIDFFTAQQYNANRIPGATYTVGPALALMINGTKPLVIPTGA